MERNGTKCVVRDGFPPSLPAALPPAFDDRVNLQRREVEVRRQLAGEDRSPMKNETLAKFVCHNITCVIFAIYERGIDPTFLGLAKDDEPRDVIRFPGTP